MYVRICINIINIEGLKLDLGLGLGSKLKINKSSIDKNFLKKRVKYIGIRVISYIYICNAIQTVQNW